MKYENKKNKTDYALVYKIIMYILVIGYIIFFIYQLLTKDFNIDKNINRLKIILLFLSIFILGCATITTKKASIALSITNYLVIIILILINFNLKLPNFRFDKEKTDNKKVSGKLECNGKTDTSDNTIINVYYTGNKIDKIVYTYIYDLKNQTGAENLSNHYDKKYADFANIYSEITISDDVQVKVSFNLDRVDIDKLKEIDKEHTVSFKELKDKELKNLSCKEVE